MSLFKVLRGSEANLPTKKTDGWAYFCTDTGSFWIDYQDANNTLVRSKISANFADKLRYIEDGKTVELDPSEIATHTDLDNKVNKVNGKGLSSNDLTNTLKGNYDSAYTHSQSAHAPTNAQANIIETVKVNGTAQTITNKTVNITVPTGSLASKSKVSESDLDSTLASKLSGKADSSHTHNDIYFTETEIDNKLSGYVPTSRKVNGKALDTDVTLSASDVGALSSDTEIPSALADLTTDSTHRTVTDNEKATWNAKSDFSGNYNDLTNKPTIPSVAGLATETYVDNAVSTKVDKVTGKGLSTNDLTNALKGNYDSAYTHSQAAHAPVGAQANVIESVKVNGTALTVTGKAVNVTVPTGALASKSKVSESDLDSTLATKLNGKADSDHNHNDVYYTENEIDTKLSGKADTSHSHNDLYYTETEVDTKLDNKVDKVNGKGLSTNDYTTTEKNKLAGIEAGANKYVLPSATDSVVGGMKLYTATGTNTAGTMTQKAITDALAGKSGTGHNHDSVYSKLGHTHTAAEVGATTQTYVDNQIKDAKSYTDTKVANLVDSSPDTLNTLNELAAALGDDPNFATTMATELGKKATKDALNAHTGNTTVHITSTERTNWTAAKTHADSTHAPSNAERNIIVGIQKNGTDVSVNSTTRKVNITVPTKTSELTNNSDFATNASVTSAKNALQANIDTHTESKNNPHGVTAAQVGAAPVTHEHSATDITDGVLPVSRGGTGNNAGYVRVGQKTGTAIGTKATIEGTENTASGDYSHVEGSYSKAIGNSSHAEGKWTTSSGDWSHAEGNDTKTGGTSPASIGADAPASGLAAHAEGYGSVARAGYSHAEGNGTVADGVAAHSEGQSTKASGNYAHAEGLKSTASGVGSHAEGDLTEAIGGYSHAEGCKTYAYGASAHTEGYKTSTGFKGYSNVRHASFNNTGNSTLIIESTEPAKYYSIGDNLQIGLVDGSILKDKFKINEIYEINWGGPVPDATQIKLSKLTDEDITISISDIKYIAVYNKPYGDIVIAIGENAHAEGNSTQALGEASHAEGKETSAIGDNSHASGLGTIAAGENQTVVGQYNEEVEDAVFVVGCGTGDSDRKNAFTVNKDGSAIVSGNFQAEGADFNNTVAFHDDVTMDNALEIRSFATVDEVIEGYEGKSVVNVEYLNAQLNALITVADIDTICGGNIVAASEVTF